MTRSYDPETAQQCLDWIDYMYDLYEQSLQNVVLEETWKSKLLELGLVHARFLYLSTEVLRLLGISLIPSTTVIGLIAQRTTSPHEGVIVFRGTKSVAEWMKNFMFYSQQDLSKVSTTFSKSPSSYRVGGLAPFLGFSFPQECPWSPKVSSGFYQLYHSWTGLPSKQEQGCVCASSCHTLGSDPFTKSMLLKSHINLSKISQVTKNKGTCEGYASSSSYSKIGGKCSSIWKAIPCDRGEYFGVGPSIGMQILQHTSFLLSTQGVQRFVITGHSLGGALAQITALHLCRVYDKSVIQNIYTFASPRVGNVDFVKFTERYAVPRKYHFRFANLADVVTNIPLPFNGGVCYAHSGNMDFTFQDVSILKGDCSVSDVKAIHATTDYRRHIRQLELQHIKEQQRYQQKQEK